MYCIKGYWKWNKKKTQMNTLSIFNVFMYGCFACLYVWTTCMPGEAGGVGSSEIEFEWALGIEPKTFAWAASGLNY